MPEEPTCPTCGQPLTQVGAFWICPQHGQVALDKPFSPQRLFISYGHDEQADLARRLRDDLLQRGHEVWFDEQRLIAGYDWEDFIDRGLQHLAADKANSAVILLLTPHAVRRPEGYCLNEVARAVSAGLRIIPLMVVESLPPLSISRIQWLDLRKCIPISEKQILYEPLFERLLRAIEQGELDFEGTQQRLIKALQPLEFDADLMKHLPKFTGRKWVFDKIDNWLKDPDGERVFWICGGPGVGKTALSAVLTVKYQEVAALHLCQAGHRQKSDPRRLVSSLAYQLSTQLPEYEAKLALRDVESLAQDDAPTMFDNLLVQPLMNITPPDRKIVLLIDALDEATEGERNILASFLARQFSETPPWLRLIITSRPDKTVTGPLQALEPFVLDTDNEANRDDLREYLKHELAAELADRSDAELLVDRIVQKSEMVFLYIEQVCLGLHHGNLSLDQLDQFPQGLGGVFWQYFERQFPGLEHYRRDIRPVLRAILAAQEPLPVSLLQSFFGWQEEELKDFLRSLGSLFVVVIENKTQVVKPYHKAVADWLGDETKSGKYFISEAEGHKLIATYFEDEYQRQGFASMAPYLVRYILLHLHRSDKKKLVAKLSADPGFIAARNRLGLRRVFISHAHDFSVELACRVAEDLQACGHHVYIDLAVDASVNNWALSVEQALASSDTVLFLMTPKAVSPSSFCLSELAYASMRGISILPVKVVAEVDPPLLICRIQWLDMRDCLPISENETKYKQAFTQLREALESEAASDKLE